MHTPSPLALRALLLASALPLLAACGNDEALSPLPVATASALPDAGPPPTDAGPDDAAPPPDAGPKKRTVMQRNPFGNVAKSENLLWDGDFEWSSPFSDQYGWLAGPPFSYTFDNIVVGAACRSGLKCAKLAKKKAIVAIGVASAGEKLQASFWAHLEADGCDKIKSTVSDFFDKLEPDVPITAPSATPDEGGWCHFSTVIEARAHKPFLYIENRTTGAVIIDDAVLEKASGSMPLSLMVGPPTAEDSAALGLAAEQIGKLRGPHDSPPNQARRALTEWKKP